MTTTTLRFEEETHSYFLKNGSGERRIPSVTQILSAVIPRKFNAGDWFMERGSALHKAISLYASGQLDWASVDERYKPKLAAFLKFEKDTGYVVKESEMPLASEKFRYAGCVDAVMVNPNEMMKPYRVILVDFKSSIEPTVRLQIAAYRNLLEENGHTAPEVGMALELCNDGKYKCLWIQKQEMRIAWQRFLAALTIYNFMQENGMNKKEE